MVKKAIAGSIAGAAIMLSSFAPMALADTTFSISGNGSWSRNSISADSSNKMIVSQSNDTNVDNNVDIHNNTGGNSASDNTGGDVSLSTGDALAAVEIHNMAGSNVAHLSDSCGCDNGDHKFIISGNGSKSKNEIDVSKDNFFLLDQHNDTDFDNNVDVHNNTGHNDVDDNTSSSWWKDWWKSHGSSGDFSLETGDAEAHVLIHNMAGHNMFN